MGHEHTLTLPVTIGPLALRILLMVVVPAITGFVLMRLFLPEPGRTERAALAVTAAVTVVLELLLARTGLRIPEQIIPLLLAAIAVPMRLTFARRQQSAAIAAWLDWIGRAVLVVAAAAAGFQFVLGWLTAGSAESASRQITGVVLGVVGLAWYVSGRPPRAWPVRLAVQAVAGALAIATFAGAAQALALSLPDAQPQLPGQSVQTDQPTAWRAVERAPF
jgi:hypothetical protein